MNSVDLAREMAAARKRREEKTARELREARAQALRAAVRPGSPRAEVEARARSFYPRLSEELLEEAISAVCRDRPVPEASPAPIEEPLPDPPAA